MADASVYLTKDASVYPTNDLSVYPNKGHTSVLLSADFGEPRLIEERCDRVQLHFLRFALTGTAPKVHSVD